jgi:hypothetical protein
MPKDRQESVEQSLRYSHAPLCISIIIGMAAGAKKVAECIQVDWEIGRVTALFVLAMFTPTFGTKHRGHEDWLITIVIVLTARRN